MKNNFKYALGAMVAVVAAGTAEASITISTIDDFTIAFDTGVSTGFNYTDRKSDVQSGLSLPSGFSFRAAQVGGTGSRLSSAGNGLANGSVAAGSGGFAQLGYSVAWQNGEPALNLSDATFSIALGNLSGGTLKLTMWAYSYTGGYSNCVINNVGSDGVITFDRANFVGDSYFGSVNWSQVTDIQLKIENTSSGVAQFGLSNFSVPAPSAVALLGAAGLFGRRRRG